jgi:hypothetical protein
MSHSMGDDEDALIVAALVALDAGSAPSAARAMVVDRLLARFAAPGLPCALARVAARYAISVAPAWTRLTAHGATTLPCDRGHSSMTDRHAEGVCEACPRHEPPPTLRP